MRLTTRSGLIATSLAIAAIAGPNASAGSGVQGSTPGPWAGPMSSGPLSVAPTPPRASSPSNGFHYGDAAIGAGVMAGLTLLAASGTLTARRRRHPRHS
jgi:hypothetical protein